MTVNKKAAPSVQANHLDETVFQNIQDYPAIFFDKSQVGETCRLCCVLIHFLEITGKEVGGHDEC
jgi:hypothetical protein